MACSFDLSTPFAVKEWAGAEAAKKIIETAWEKNVIRLVQDDKAQKGSSNYLANIEPKLCQIHLTIVQINTDILLRLSDRYFGSRAAQAQTRTE